MRVAVTYENESVYWHFGRAERFKIYDIEQGEIVVTAVVNMNGSNHSELVKLLKQMEISHLICGGIGEVAKEMMVQEGIEVYFGIDGSCDEAVEKLIKGTLKGKTENRCECKYKKD